MSGCQFAEFFFEAPQPIVVRCMAAHGLNGIQADLQRRSNGSAERTKLPYPDLAPIPTVVLFQSLLEGAALTGRRSIGKSGGA